MRVKRFISRLVTGVLFLSFVVPNYLGLEWDLYVFTIIASCVVFYIVDSQYTSRPERMETHTFQCKICSHHNEVDVPARMFGKNGLLKSNVEYTCSNCEIRQIATNENLSITV